MVFSFKILFFDEDKKRFVCFKHAVQLAMKNIDIDVEVDENSDSDYDFRDKSCYVCGDN